MLDIIGQIVLVTGGATAACRAILMSEVVTWRPGNVWNRPGHRDWPPPVDRG
jgi:hypothetical protein